MEEQTQDGGVVANEVAEAEFERFLEVMDLDFDAKGMDDEDRKGFLDSKQKFIRAIRRGSLVVNDRGEPVFTPVKDQSQRPITFHEPDGACMMARDQKKASHDVAKMYATLAAMTHEDAKRFARMPSRDLKVCEAILLLFLA